MGRTTFSNILANRATENKEKYNIDKVVIINEETSCPNQTKHQCYINSHAEKSTRSALKAEFDRKSGKDGKKTLILFDSLNYIKGFRYELYCITKASSDKHGVVWVQCEESTAKRWNQERIQRLGELSSSSSCSFYTEEIMDGLNYRYEPPDERNRWDKPLYHVDMNNFVSFTSLGSAGRSDLSPDGQMNVDETERKKSLEQKADEILDSFLLQVKPLKMGVSTQTPFPASSNVSLLFVIWRHGHLNQIHY